MNERGKNLTCSKQTRKLFYSVLWSAFQAFYSILLNALRSTPFSNQLATVELPPYDPYNKGSSSNLALVDAAGGGRGNRRGNTLPAGGKPALSCGAAVRDVLGDRCTRCFRETICGAGSRRARGEIQIGAHAFQFGGA